MAIVPVPYYVEMWHRLYPIPTVLLLDPYNDTTTPLFVRELPPALARLQPRGATIADPPDSDVSRMLAAREYSAMAANGRGAIMWRCVAAAQPRHGLYYVRIFIAASTAYGLKRQPGYEMSFTFGQSALPCGIQSVGRCIVAATVQAPDGAVMPYPLCPSEIVLQRIGHGDMGDWFRRTNALRYFPCCVACGAKRAGKVCAACKLARYCSAECQRQDWRHHQRSCGLAPTDTPITFHD